MYSYVYAQPVALSESVRRQLPSECSDPRALRARPRGQSPEPPGRRTGFVLRPHTGLDIAWADRRAIPLAHSDEGQRSLGRPPFTSAGGLEQGSHRAAHAFRAGQPSALAKADHRSAPGVELGRRAHSMSSQRLSRLSTTCSVRSSQASTKWLCDQSDLVPILGFTSGPKLQRRRTRYAVWLLLSS